MHATLLLDIGSGSVGAGIAGIEAGSAPKILFSCRKDFRGTETAVFYALKHVLQEVFEKGLIALSPSSFPNNFDHVVIALSSPWSESKVASVRKSGADIFESAPVGQNFITSSADSALVRSIENEVIRTLGIKRGASVQSFSYVFSKVFSHLLSSPKSVLLARFAGTDTELALIRSGEIEELGHIDFGPLSIVQSLSERLKLPIELAHSMLSLFVRGELDRDTALRIDELATFLEEKWRSKWQALGIDAPQEILFTSHPSDSALGAALLSSAVPTAEVRDLAQSEYIAREKNVDASLYIIASFSAMLV
jgi:hypothetical protein